MAREYHIHGETMVYVKGGAHLALLPNSPMTSRTELGLATDQIKIIPTYKKKDIRIDNYGPEVPVDIISYMSECTIEMSLIHYDTEILNVCIAESNGGVLLNKLRVEGIAGKAGALMGKGLDYYASGNNFIGLSLVGLDPNYPYGNIYRFPTAYIVDRIVQPIGTKHTILNLTWRAIPYIPTVTISNSDYSSISGIIFDNLNDL